MTTVNRSAVLFLITVYVKKNTNTVLQLKFDLRFECVYGWCRPDGEGQFVPQCQ